MTEMLLSFAVVIFILMREKFMKLLWAQNIIYLSPAEKKIFLADLWSEIFLKQ